MLSCDPQNPYDSYMVEASAGTGKTYQLTQRFLFLVGAGADPSQILAITFTVKAVQEMHSRVISEASELLVNPDYQKQFEQKLSFFYHEFISSKPKEYVFSKPRSATKTAQVILSSTQRLKISTIDSIFYEWVMRFPTESNPKKNDTKTFSRTLNLFEPYEIERINESSWDEVFKDPESKDSFNKAFKGLENYLPNKGFISVKKQIEELHRYMLHIFYLREKDFKTFLSYKLSSQEDFTFNSLKKVFKTIENEFCAIAKETTKSEEFVEAIRNCDLKSLIKGRLLTKMCYVSKALIRGKKRERLEEVIRVVEVALTSYHNEKAKSELNLIGKNLFAIYDLWYAARERVKKKLMCCEFSDLSMGCHTLFTQDCNASTLWLLQQSVSHILIDEFQDTSMVQWDVFSSILSEILSTFESSTDQKGYKTAFVVGDRKQSIYGFREADPYVMDLASEFFCHYEKKVISLNTSYRTIPLLMGFLTNFFVSEIDPKFPVHKSAYDIEGQAVVPNTGQLMVYKLFEKYSEDTSTPLEKEARNLAQHFQKVFLSPEKYPVYDKERKVFRPIRYSDCCVLYRNATHVETFIEALNEKNIPSRKENESSFFENKEVRAVLSFFRFLIDPNDLLSLLVFLRSHFFEIAENDLLWALEKTKETPEDKRVSDFLEALTQEGFEFSEILSLKETCHSLLPHNILILIYKMLSSSSFLQDQELKKQQNISEKYLMRLLDLVMDLESKGHTTLQSCVDELEQMSTYVMQGGQEDFVDSVSFMTIHKSKGLEFPFVALVEASDTWYKFDRYWIKSSEGIYYCGTYDLMPHDDLFFKSVYQSAQKTMYEETVRLLYVALTRCSQYLFVSAHEQNSSNHSSFHQSLVHYLEKRTEPNLVVEKEYYALQSEINQEVSPDSFVTSKLSSDLIDSSVSLSPMRELRIVTPHEMLSGSSKAHRVKREKSSHFVELDERLRALIGTYIHTGLELYVKGKSHFLADLWQKTVLLSPVLIRSALSEEQLAGLLHASNNEIHDTLNSSCFKKLFLDAVEVVPEFSVVSLHGRDLIKGTIDLFIKYKSQDILLLDYKTSEISSQEDPFLFCQVKKYDKQLFSYARATKKIYPSSKITGGVWLSKIQKQVTVF